MELELRIYEVDPDFRWNWVSAVEHPLRFISLRDDRTFVSISHGGQAPAPVDTWTDEGACPPLEKLTVRRLRPALASTIASPEELHYLADSEVLEIRQYRIFPGKRARFAEFFRDRTLASQAEYGMAVHGQFDDLDDENVFTWFRGFPSVVERDRRKNAFYRSSYWLDELQDEAFSLIEDYRNVLLVTPVR